MCGYVVGSWGCDPVVGLPVAITVTSATSAKGAVLCPLLCLRVTLLDSHACSDRDIELLKALVLGQIHLPLPSTEGFPGVRHQ